jgi:putative transcription factor
MNALKEKTKFTLVSSNAMPSYCELCGRQLTTGKKTVLIDGSIFNVCIPCSKRGKPLEAVPSNSNTLSRGGKATTTNESTVDRRSYPSSKPTINKNRNALHKIQMTDDTLLASNFSKLIRDARMKKGLTHEQLANLMNERAALLKKYETGSLKPDESLAKKLERQLGIKLYVDPNSEE